MTYSVPHCSFCRIVARDAPSEIVYEDDHALAFMDAHPMTAGHTLVIPKLHVRDLFDLPDDVAGHLLRAARIVGKQVTEGMGASGLNLLNNNGAAADQSQFHLHFHLIPRYGRDRLLHPHERTFGDWSEIREHAQVIRAVESTGTGSVNSPS
jgi:histidine triad (HIT) family protein